MAERSPVDEQRGAPTGWMIAAPLGSRVLSVAVISQLATDQPQLATDQLE